MEGLIVRNATNVVKSACLLTLGDTWKSDLSLVGFSNSVKHFVFSVDELRTLLESYKKLYPGQKVEVTSNIENGVFITLQIRFTKSYLLWCEHLSDKRLSALEVGAAQLRFVSAVVVCEQKLYPYPP